MPQSYQQDTIELTSEQVLELTVETLMQHLGLIAHSDEYTAQDIWQVLIYASTQASTVEDTTWRLKDGPCANTLHNHLKAGLLTHTELQALEANISARRVAHLPPGIIGHRYRLAIDLVLIPYYWGPAQDQKEVRRSKARRGTSCFHSYATAYVIKRHKRVTLALADVQAGETFLDVLKRLLAGLEATTLLYKAAYAHNRN